MNNLEKIKIDHTRKSNQVKKLKEKLKRNLPLAKLENLLSIEERNEINWKDYYYDDEGFSRDSIKKEARIELLKDLIKIVNKNRD